MRQTLRVILNKMAQFPSEFQFSEHLSEKVSCKQFALFFFCFSLMFLAHLSWTLSCIQSTLITANSFDSTRTISPNLKVLAVSVLTLHQFNWKIFARMKIRYPEPNLRSVSAERSTPQYFSTRLGPLALKVFGALSQQCGGCFASYLFESIRSEATHL